MLTVRQNTERLSVSEANIYRLIASGKLKAHRLGVHGGAIRVSEHELTLYLQATEVVPGPEESPLPKRRLRHLKV